MTTTPATPVASDDLTAVDEAVASAIADLPSPESQRSYECVWRFYTHWLSEQRLDVRAVRPKHIQAYIAKLRAEGKVKGTVSRALTVIRSLYASIVTHELMPTNPAREVKGPRVDSAPSAPWIREEADIKKLLNVPASTWMERRDYLVVRLAFGLAWRRSNVARVAVEDIEGEMIHAIVKGGKRVTVGLPDWLAADIREWRQYASIDAGPLFPRRQDDPRPINGAGVYHIVRKQCARAGIEVVSPHSLRRTFVTHANLRDIDMKKVQGAVSHSSIVTTEKYSKANSAATTKVGDEFKDLVST